MASTSAHCVARSALAFVFAYHGLMPKLLSRHADEIAMLRDLGVPAERVGAVLTVFGVAELVLAVCLLLFWHHRWLSWLCLLAMGLGTGGVIVCSPRFV